MKPKKQVHSVVARLTVESENDFDDLPTFKAEINGQEVNFVIHTGSQVSVLSAKDAERVGVSRVGEIVELTTIAGRVDGVRTKRIAVNLAGQTGNVRFVVVESANVNLLGAAWVRNTGVIINSNEGVLKFPARNVY